MAKDGAYSYLVNGRIIGGFAAIAWPVHYGETGVMSFIVNQDGQLYEQVLGPETARPPRLSRCSTRTMIGRRRIRRRRDKGERHDCS